MSRQEKIGVPLSSASAADAGNDETNVQWSSQPSRYQHAASTNKILVRWPTDFMLLLQSVLYEYKIALNLRRNYPLFGLFYCRDLAWPWPNDLDIRAQEFREENVSLH